MIGASFEDAAVRYAYLTGKDLDVARAEMREELMRLAATTMRETMTAAAQVMEALGIAITNGYADGIRSDMPWSQPPRSPRRLARRAHNRKLKRG
jgi:hypothetical protein